jgi:poly-gamma-glutamate capsule biosynthesis protein CapA/YwtB (metallophosphatase superfamily)
MRYTVFSFIVLVFVCSSDKSILPDPARSYQIKKPDSLVTVSVSVVGDIMCHSVQYNYARVSADSFDFNPVFAEIKSYLKQSDFLFGNLETVTAGEQKRYSGYPLFNSPDAFISALNNAGFDLLTTANNHALDRGEQGIRRTIDEMKLNHMDYTGTFLSEKDRDSIRIYNIKGIRIALLAYTYGTNGIPVPKGKKYLLNIIDTTVIRNDIKLTREKGADIVLIYFHFGDENQRFPNSYQKEIVNKSIAAGADIIIGGHTHVLQPVSFYKPNNTELDTGFVIYSMGNFVSNQRWRFSDGGAVLSFSLTKNFDHKSVHLDKVEYLPIWVFRGFTESGKQYIIIPSESALMDSSYSFLTPYDRKMAIQSFNDTRGILTRISQKPALRNIFPGQIVQRK